MMNGGAPSLSGMMGQMDSTPNDPAKGFASLLDQAEAGKMMSSGQMMPGANPPGAGPNSATAPTLITSHAAPIIQAAQGAGASSSQMQALLAYLKSRQKNG